MDEPRSEPRVTGAFRSTTGRALVFAVAMITIATAISLVVLWPGETPTAAGVGGLAGQTENAEVTAIEQSACVPPQEGECVTASVRLGSGPDAGQEEQLQLGGTISDPELSVGEDIRVAPTVPPAGASQASLPPGAPAYTFSDYERRSPMLWLAIAFAALVIAFGRLRGALSLLGLAASLAVVLVFIVPAILDGSSALAVAITGSLAVMLLTIALAHGLNAKSLAAILGTTLSLLLVAGLAAAFTELTHLTGLSEETTLLQSVGFDVDFQGLLLAGMVIGSLGVLDDVTVSQASTVLALHRTDPELGFGRLYRRAIEVGRDHVSATVNTLVLAYVGASLPILLLFSAGSAGLVDTLNVGLVAKEVVAALVGSIGLIAAVPITTALTALLCRDMPADALPAGATHAH